VHGGAPSIRGLRRTMSAEIMYAKIQIELHASVRR
jgi:hypothetical protein